MKTHAPRTGLRNTSCALRAGCWFYLSCLLIPLASVVRADAAISGLELKLSGSLDAMESSIDQLIAQEDWSTRETRDITTLLQKTSHQAQGMDSSMDRLGQQLDRHAALISDTQALDAIERLKKSLTSSKSSSYSKEFEAPPFELVSVELWSNRPLAFLRTDKGIVTTRQGAQFGDWRVDRIDAVARTVRLLNVRDVTRTLSLKTQR